MIREFEYNLHKVIQDEMERRQKYFSLKGAKLQWKKLDGMDTTSKIFYIQSVAEAVQNRNEVFKYRDEGIVKTQSEESSDDESSLNLSEEDRQNEEEVIVLIFIIISRKVCNA